MNQQIKEHYVKAGKAVQKAKVVAEREAEEGVSFAELAEEIEKTVREEGCEPAFPVNLSRNNEAAHYTPGPSTERVLKASDVLKIDIGAHSNGYIADTAITVNPSGEYDEMIEAAREVLKKAIEYVKPGVTVGEFGTYVENQVPDEYNIVQNLTGHYIDHYKQHAGVSIPNKHNQNTHEFEKGDSVAIEPFLTTGTGRVRNGKDGNIYKLENERSVRGRNERKLMKKMKDFNGLPFTTRWFDNFGGRERMAMKKMIQNDIVHSYPILRDEDGSVVVQAEQTVLVGEDDGDNLVTTRR